MGALALGDEQPMLAWRATWQARAPGQGLEVLQDRSSLPEGRRWDPAVIREVQKVKATHPDWGAQQIALHLRYAPFNGKLERCLEARRRFSRCRETLALLEALGEGIFTRVHEHNYLVYNENLGGLTPSQAFLERQPIQPPEHVEVVRHRREGDQLILKFTNRDGRPARKVLTLGA